MQFIELNM